MSPVANGEAAGGLAIELRGLRKVYAQGQTETVAVDNLDLEVRRGEIFGLLGPNGAGKTTTVEICEGLTPETAGDVCVLGRRWRSGEDRDLRDRIGVCLQETRFFDKQSVRETLTLFRACYDTGRSVDEALELVSLTDKAKARQKSLSGGQRQRLAVATALLGDPELLFLDEPTTGLDPQSRRQLWEVIRSFRRRGGTALLTTHYMEEAEQLCDRVGIVDQGRLIALGTPQELIRALGAEQVIEATVHGAEDRLDLAALRQLAGVQTCEIESGQVILKVESVHEVLPLLLARFKEAGADLDGLATRHATLEDVFVDLTGRHLREGA